MEAICWVFDTVPSRVPRLLWSHSKNDIDIKIKLKVGLEQAKIVQDFQTIAEVVGLAFGGKKNTSSDNAMQPRNFEEMQNAMAQVLGRR